MATLSLDDAAWTNRWSRRSTLEKASLSGGLMLVALTARHPLVSATVTAFASVAAVAGAGVPARTWVRALAAPTTFVLVGLVGVVFSVGPVGTAGDVLASWGPVSVTSGSLARAVEVGARTVAATSALALLATTTPVTHLLDALGRSRLPPVLIELAAMVYRFLLTLLESQARIRQSQAARLGYRGPRQAYRSLGMLAAATFVRAWTHAQRLEAGLAGRGGTGSLRTVPRLRPAQRSFLAASCAAVLALGVLSLVSPAWQAS